MSDALLTRIAEGVERLHRLFEEAQGVKAPEPAKPKKVKAADPTPAAQVAAQPAAATAAPINTTVTVTPAPAAPAAPAAGTASGDLMTQTANAVIDLANNYSRDAALAVLAKYGAQKVSQIKPENLQAVLNDVYAAIAAEKAKKANESLV